jgi:hypothetical protein
MNPSSMKATSDKERSPILNRAWGLFGAIVIGAMLGHASPALAVKTSFWRTDDLQGFLQGEHVAGVALESDGYLTMGPAWDSVATRLEGVSYIWCVARDSKGRVYFGTGDNGRIYRWTREKGASVVWETGAGEITSLAIDKADNVYAGIRSRRDRVPGRRGGGHDALLRDRRGIHLVPPHREGRRALRRHGLEGEDLPHHRGEEGLGPRRDEGRERPRARRGAGRRAARGDGVEGTSAPRRQERRNPRPLRFRFG